MMQVCAICGWDKVPDLASCPELSARHCKFCHDLLHTNLRDGVANTGV